VRLDDRFAAGAAGDAPNVRRSRRPPSSGATHRRVASQGMSGWSQAIQASCVPSGESSGARYEVAAGDDDASGVGRRVGAERQRRRSRILGRRRRPVAMILAHREDAFASGRRSQSRRSGNPRP
jgi:hypothetical protein